jgi:hypothetical protein
MGTQKLDRREFFAKAMEYAVLVGGPLLLAACGSGSSSSSASASAPSQTGGNCSLNGSQAETTSITEEHTHTIQLTAADITEANTSNVFTTSDDDGHTHPVQLTADQYMSLQANQGVSLSTGPGGDGHTHTLTINCA